MSEPFLALVAFLILAPMILIMIVQSYIAHKYTEHFESFLPNCIFVKENIKIFQHAGLPGKLLRTGLIALVLVIPYIFMRRGLIDMDEVKRFPLRTKQFLTCLLVLQFALIFALALLNYALPET
ncbi:hypothetical protein [Pseudomonas sp. DC3200b2]|uniref:hypothetical protein n=1 Tax=Pseudomonas sp. DC3200b2 TaxID=2804669 RepID=UPI003CEABC53